MSDSYVGEVSPNYSSSKSVELKAQIIAFSDKRIEHILSRARMWGGKDAVFGQLIQALEYRALTCDFDSAVLSRFRKYVNEIAEEIPEVKNASGILMLSMEDMVEHLRIFAEREVALQDRSCKVVGQQME